jgi:hypothetical protein
LFRQGYFSLQSFKNKYHTEMAKKVVATLKTGAGKEYSKVITMNKSPKTGAYSFKEIIVHNDHVKDAIAGVKTVQ